MRPGMHRVTTCSDEVLPGSCRWLALLRTDLKESTDKPTRCCMPSQTMLAAVKSSVCSALQL